MQNKQTHETVEEGVKSLIAALAAIPVLKLGSDYVADYLKKQDEPVQDKIQAVEYVKKAESNSKFDKVMDDVIAELETEYPKAEPVYPKAIPVSDTVDAKDLKPRTVSQSTPEPTNKDYANFIMTSEIYGTDIRTKDNARFLKPYQDDKKLWTVGIGRLIGKGRFSDKQEFEKKYGTKISPDLAMQFLEEDINRFVKVAKRVFGESWKDFSPELKLVLVDIGFRGDLVPKKVGGGEFKFVKLLKQGRFEEAAKEYLDHKEYKKRKAQMAKDGTGDGVVKRMNRNAAIMSKQKRQPVLVK